MAYTNEAMQQNQTPSHVEAISADAYYLKSDLIKDFPNLLSTYYKQGGRQATTMEVLGALQFGRLSKSPSDSPFTGHYEKPITKQLVHIGSIAAGAVTKEAVITLDAQDMYVLDNGVGARTRPASVVRVKDTLDVGIANRKFLVVAKNTAVNPNTITIHSNDGSNPLDVLSAGDVMNIFGNVSAEATGQNTSLLPLKYRYQNTFWISKDTDTISGSHLTTKVGFNVVPGSGKLYLEGMEDMEDRNRVNKGQIWMFGSKATDWSEFSEPANDTFDIAGTEGLYDAVYNSGFNMFYDPNDFGLEDLRELTNYYQSINLSTTDILLMQGMRAKQTLEDSVRDLINYNWVIGVSDQYVMKNKKEQWGSGVDKDYNPEGMFINLGINGFVVDGYTFLQKASPEFNNAFGAGAVGDYISTMIAAPIGNARNADNTPYTGYEYRGSDGYNRENEVWFKAGAGNSGVVGGKAAFYKTSQYDAVSYYIRSEFAPHFSLLNQFALIRENQASS